MGLLAALALAALVAGCATTRMESEWRDPTFAGGSLKGKRVLVVCQARDETVRRVCEDQWVFRLGGQGVSGTQSYTVPGFPPGGAANPDQLKGAAQASGATAVLSTQLTASPFTVVNPPAQVGIGVGGGSGSGTYRGGSFGWGGFGVTLPVGGATASQGLSASTTLVDAASGMLVWSGSASTPATGDVTAQVAALTQVTGEALAKAGLI